VINALSSLSLTVKLFADCACGSSTNPVPFMVAVNLAYVYHRLLSSSVTKHCLLVPA
jgi:hypothetical protein